MTDGTSPMQIKLVNGSVQDIARFDAESLVTTTPNSHMRPCDVTDLHRPPHSRAEESHLREPTPRKVTARLHQAGFERVAPLLFVTRRPTALVGCGAAAIQRRLEPAHCARLPRCAAGQA